MIMNKKKMNSTKEYIQKYIERNMKEKKQTEVTLQHQPAHISSYRPIGWPSPMSPKYMAGPISSLSNPRFIPHIGNSVPFGIVITASTYLFELILIHIK